MKCQRCDQHATFHITELTGDEPVEIHLCEQCAQEYLQPKMAETPDGMPPLTGVLSEQLSVGQTAEELARLDQQACPMCGITFLEFRKQGRLGCPNDYTCFEKELEPLLQNIHGETLHVGKVPKRSPLGGEKQTKLIRLRREMKESILSENYERASELRDEITSLEKKGKAKKEKKKEDS